MITMLDRESLDKMSKDAIYLYISQLHTEIEKLKEKKTRKNSVILSGSPDYARKYVQERMKRDE